MTGQKIEDILQQQKEYFSTGATLSLQFRLRALGRIKEAIKKNEKMLYQALYSDLGKSRAESFMCELGLTLSEIGWMERHLKKLMEDKRVKTPLAQFAAKSFQSPCPYGNVLIMSPWNYPVLLTLEPLVDALAAGNTAILKPSAYAPASSLAIKRLLEECFPRKYVCVVTGGRQENQALLQQRFDKIFFTGSPAVGKEVLRHASEYLTPVTLELGGKSPCVVEKSSNIPLAARRIVFGKFINCGQTCVAPDYILCDESIRDALVAAIIKEIKRQFGSQPLENNNYGKIVNEKHYKRLMSMVIPKKIVFGGRCDVKSCRIEPTVMTDVDWEDAVMQEEIFGPLLPILTYKSIENAWQMIDARPHPLALYCFTENPSVKRQMLSRCRFGGGCINDTVIHLASSEMPFGGVGESGMGCYHGKAGFEEFSHYRSIVDKKTWFDLPVRYQPYTKGKFKLTKLFFN